MFRGASGLPKFDQAGENFQICTEDDNSCYRNVCKMSVVSFALAVVFIIRLFSTSAFRVPILWKAENDDIDELNIPVN